MIVIMWIDKKEWDSLKAFRHYYDAMHWEFGLCVMTPSKIKPFKDFYKKKFPEYAEILNIK